MTLAFEIVGPNYIEYMCCVKLLCDYNFHLKLLLELYILVSLAIS